MALAITREESGHGASVANTYLQVKHIVRDHGYACEAEWQATRSFEEFSESDLLRETAWVILCSGFRERVVRKRFGVLSLCFCDWESAEVIATRKDVCLATAISVLNHLPKMNAIVRVAEMISDSGFPSVKTAILKRPIEALSEFPFIGPITSYHLAKNLGLNIAKPDRHLVRIAQEAGYEDVQALCGEISSHTGDPVCVVDMVLWRYATIEKDYLRCFSKQLMYR